MNMNTYMYEVRVELAHKTLFCRDATFLLYHPRTTLIFAVGLQSNYPSTSVLDIPLLTRQDVDSAL
jgi:hypothetical protein